MAPVNWPDDNKVGNLFRLTASWCCPVFPVFSPISFCACPQEVKKAGCIKGRWGYQQWAQPTYLDAVLAQPGFLFRQFVQIVFYFLYHSCRYTSGYTIIRISFVTTAPAANDYIIPNPDNGSAQNMLRYSEYSYAEISTILAYSSQSHFTKVFRGETGYTSKEYRQKFYRAGYWKK